jgi:RNA polymerase sigma factor (sigma-70 family)
MVGDVNGRKWVGDDSDQAEAAFRETLQRLQADGAGKQEIAETVMRSPFILGLVWIVTSRNYVARRRGPRSEAGSVAGGEAGRTTKRRGVPRLPESWGESLRKDPSLREEWRCEAVYLLGRACQRGGLLRCDPDSPTVGGYWRVIIMYKAVKAAWKLWRESRFWGRQGQSLKEDVVVQSCDLREKARAGEDGLTDRREESRRRVRQFTDERQDETLTDQRLDLAMAIDELENPRQRKVMRLSAMGYDYPEIAAKEGLSYEMVRYAVKNAREELKKRLRRVG